MSATSPSAALDDLGPVVAEGVVRSFLGRPPVLDGIDLVVAPGSRVGLVGENGSGKSTLLRILAGRDRPDHGTVRVPADLVHVPQQPELAAGSTVGDLLDTALHPLLAGVAELERLAEALGSRPGDVGVQAAYDRALAWATHHDAWDAVRRADATAATLGVGGLDRDRPVATLSGGQRTRLALAAALVRRPACLLLDEPTNHLDDTALELLERTLVELPGVVVTASHDRVFLDRVFLDRVCTEVLDLDAGALGTDGRGGRRFGGRFTAYLSQQRQARQRWEETYAAQQDELERLRGLTRQGLDTVAPGRGPRDNDKFVHAFKGARVERSHARRVHDAERRLEVAEREQLPRPPEPLRFRGSLTGTGGGAVVVTGLEVTDRLTVDDLRVPGGGRLLVTGPNGAGKSTLLEVLAGRLRPDAGRVDVAARTVALLAQDPEVGDPGRTARRAYVDAVGPATAERVPLRSLGLLHPRDHTTAVGALSLGQQRRLALAVAVARAPDLLLLDEPTNHVSLRLAAELEEALGTAPGTVVVTSHDRWLRARWDGPEHALRPPGRTP